MQKESDYKQIMDAISNYWQKYPSIGYNYFFKSRCWKISATWQIISISMLLIIIGVGLLPILPAPYNIIMNLILTISFLVLIITYFIRMFSSHAIPKETIDKFMKYEHHHDTLRNKIKNFSSESIKQVKKTFENYKLKHIKPFKVAKIATFISGVPGCILLLIKLKLLVHWNITLSADQIRLFLFILCGAFILTLVILMESILVWNQEDIINSIIMILEEQLDKVSDKASQT